jgi:hypothetical protein
MIYRNQHNCVIVYQAAEIMPSHSVTTIVQQPDTTRTPALLA